ncbi:carbohydrate sulfotransferase 1-like isoform X2 [Bolinopsis microptera]|uniref:carbohydrate sulfotransferase 1-like isoform X2 n=1 Tax=Bolinopsis microptera TaxID=2820187 RepID=UPI00307A1FDC
MISRRDIPVGLFTIVVTVIVLCAITAYRNCFDGTLQPFTNQEIRAEIEVKDSTLEQALKDHQSSENVPVSNSKTKLVIIATESRSGSTWLGTIFQMIPDLMYVFEPLDARHASGMGYPHAQHDPFDNRQLSEDSKLKVLSSLCTCKFQTIQAFGKAPVTVEQSSHTEYNLHKEVLKGRNHMETFCSEFSVVMPKCIRLTDLSILKRLPEFGCSNFQVVHLIRDPRAVLRSRMVTFHELYSGNGQKTADSQEMSEEMIYEAAVALCTNGVKNGATAKEPWLQERYIRIRYQDMVDKPYDKVEELYNFVNKPVTERVTNFVDTSMTGHSVGSNFGVIKDSKAVAEKWRTMDGDKIAIIEKACSEFLKTFDYELFDGNT